jgi:hypothetical protein
VVCEPGSDLADHDEFELGGSGPTSAARTA